MLDAHTHFLARSLPAPDAAAVEQGWPVLVEREGYVEVLQRGVVVRRLTSSAWDAATRLGEMRQLGVEQQIVMPSPFTFLYDAEAVIASSYATAQNDALVDLVAEAPDRFFGLGSLPLQDPGAAVAEARRIAGLPGMHGVEIGTHAHTFLLHDLELAPVFAELERLGLAVFVHPWQPVAPDRTAHHGLAFGLGRAVETELAVGSLVFGGLLERHPDLRVCLAHGGAGIPATRGRLHNGWSRQVVEERVPARSPRELLRRLWADGLTYDPMALALAEDTFGPDRMVVGSDYPFAARERQVAASYLGAAQRGLISADPDWRERTRANALNFLGPEFLTHNPSPENREHNAMEAFK